jgi:hypothetical protein
MRRREQVERELGQGCDERERRRREEQREREEEVDQVADPFAVERCREQAARVREDGLHDLARRPSQSAVASVEARRGARVEVGHHDPDGDRRQADADRSDCGSLAEPSPRKGVPDAHAGDHERDLLLRHRPERGEDGEGNEAVLVEVPEGIQQERARERDGMEIAQGQPVRGRVEEVRQRETEGGPLRAEVLPGKPEHRQRAERDRDRLGREEHARARPEPPERGEENEDRVDVRAQSRNLLALEVCHRQRMPVRSRPDGLGHVAEVEAPRVERAVAKDREGAEAERVGPHCRPQKPLRPGDQSSSSIKDRHLAPSTSSLACSS